MHFGKTIKIFGAICLAGVATADIAQAAAAKRAGGSGFSGTLSGNKSLQLQQLACDPDSPLSGSTSVEYDPAVSHLSGFGFGPGYSGGAFVEVLTFSGESQRAVFQPIQQFLQDPAGPETGYIQTFYTLTGEAGQIAIPENFTFFDHAGPESVDTHFFNFEAVPFNTIVASDLVSVVEPGQTFDTAIYRIFADAGTHGGNPADYMLNVDEQGAFVIPASQIAEAVVQAPEPSALALLGLGVAGLLGRRRRQA